MVPRSPDGPSLEHMSETAPTHPPTHQVDDFAAPPLPRVLSEGWGLESRTQGTAYQSAWTNTTACCRCLRKRSCNVAQGSPVQGLWVSNPSVRSCPSRGHTGHPPRMGPPLSFEHTTFCGRAICLTRKHGKQGVVKSKQWYSSSSRARTTQWAAVWCVYKWYS